MPPGPVDAKKSQLSSPTLPQPAPSVAKKKAEQEYTGPTTSRNCRQTPIARRRRRCSGRTLTANRCSSPPVKQQRDKKRPPPLRRRGQARDADERRTRIRRERQKTASLEREAAKDNRSFDQPWNTHSRRHDRQGSPQLRNQRSEIRLLLHTGNRYDRCLNRPISRRSRTEEGLRRQDPDRDCRHEHTVQLSSDNRLLGKSPQSAYVLVDKNYSMATRFPMMGYVPIRVAPYAWPGSKTNGELAGEVAPPPLPTNLRPTLALQPCPAGQMRTAAQSGQTPMVNPCVPIAQNKTATTSANQAAQSTRNTRTQNEAEPN